MQQQHIDDPVPPPGSSTPHINTPAGPQITLNHSAPAVPQSAIQTDQHPSPSRGAGHSSTLQTSDRLGSWQAEYYRPGYGQHRGQPPHRSPKTSSHEAGGAAAREGPHPEPGATSSPTYRRVSGLSRKPSYGKRSSSRQTVHDSSMIPSPVKKARTGASPPRMADMPAPALGGGLKKPSQPEGATSPLFFSHSAGSRHSSRHASNQSSDTTTSILAKLHDEPSGPVTTLKMPRARVDSASGGRSGTTPSSWGSSMDTSAPALTPDSRSLAPALQGLSGVDVLELLDQDDRPTFLVDLGNPANSSRHGMHVLFYNTALRASPSALRLLIVGQDGSTAATDFGNFKSWVTTSVKSAEGPDPPLPQHTYGNITWACSTLRKRLRVVSAVTPIPPDRVDSPLPLTEEPIALDQQIEDPSPDMPLTPGTEALDPLDYFGEAPAKPDMANAITVNGIGTEPALDTSDRHHPDEFTNAVLQAQPARSTFDWTRIPITDELPEHIKLARSKDWCMTPLGPIEDWPHELRAMSNMVMGSPHPAALYWGPEHYAIYNAAYIDLAGQKHPSLMGSRYEDAWSEIWSQIQPVFQAAWESGQATMKHDNQLFIMRHGFLEETFFSWSIVPLVGAEGEVVGLYNPAFENTRRKVTERRMLTLRETGERIASATTVQEFWPQVKKGLEYNEYDVPFALIYSTKDDTTESEVSSMHSASTFYTPQLVLEGSIGIGDNHHAAIDSLDLRTSDDGFAPYMRQSMANNGSVIVLSAHEGTLPQDLVRGVEWKGFGDPCSTIVVFPVVPTTTGESVVGFIIMGVNPRRPYDDDYKLFIHLLSRQLATSMASVLLFEEEIKRGQRAARLAALDRQQLSLQLQLKSQEANESEYKFTRMAEFAPVGMFIANPTGYINYCNDMWWQISQVPPSMVNANDWMDYVRDEDKPAMQAAWQKLLHDKVTVSVEFRFKCDQKSGDATIDTWVLMSAYPEKTYEGHLKSIFGCITDISSQKWAEKVQNERRAEAVELKRQQENFIDITSHEMRNPLSAILQCADQIASNITSFTSHHLKHEVESLLEGCLDAANTINLCASHQKRIVDDILTLSKLDSKLLAVTPIDEQPVRVIQRALKMFESELVAHDIEFEFIVDESFEKYGIKWAKLDPSRLRQVLINLMTNAIKFTQSREKRNITVTVSAIKDVSRVTQGRMHYFERNERQRPSSLDIDKSEDWGDGELFFIHCSVEDTGPGLVEEELKVLFQRFQQATPRTHVQYGGSGLGLFISRILTEMQGGQIGVLSTPGQGSKFSFYIQSRVSLHPPSEYEHISPFKIARKVPSPAVPVTTTPTPVAVTRSNPPDAKTNPLFDVLIVEDNIVNQKVLQRQLRNCGNNTFVANHGQEALQCLQRSRFWSGQEKEGVDISVILMDLEMPVMDGMTCAKRIRELEKEGTIVKHIPIIAVTAYARPEQIQSAKAAGIDDVISKPFRIPELLPKIEELVSRYKNLSVTEEE